jgi:hypothetical protein
MNQYLQKLHALRVGKAPAPLTDKTDKTYQDTANGGFVSFVSAQSMGFFDPEARSGCMPEQAPNQEKGAPPERTKLTEPFARTITALEARCPDLVPVGRWQLAVEDSRSFLARWGDKAEALGWTARDLFGLHTPAAKPHPSYSRLSPYDETGLIWLLQGREVVALTETTAAIQSRTGAVTIYRKHNKPALGPPGDSLDDLA